MVAKDEIITGLKNAYERGEDIETAIKTLTVSGYDQFEVNEAAKSIIKEVTDAQLPEGQKLLQQQTEPTANTPAPSEKQTPSQESAPLSQEQLEQEREQAKLKELQIQAPRVTPSLKKRDNKKLVLILIIIFLLAIAGVLTYLLITNFIK